MTSTVIRRCLTGAVALAAMAAVVALAPATSAEASPEVSPFAGSYVWGDVPITISDNGRITDSYSGVLVKVNGKVNDDGSYSFTTSVTIDNPADFPGRGRGPKWITFHNSFAGNMALDDAGNIVGTSDIGDSFVWLRQ